MQGFTLLKRTYPISQCERECDGYNYLQENTTEEQRAGWGVDLSKLRKTIRPQEKYIYQVAKEGDEFRAFCCSYENYAIVRKFIFGIVDDK
jgi:hypothetical protein